MSRHTNGSLEYYERYWYQARGYGPEQARRRQRQLRKRAGVSGFGSSDDPLGTQTPAAQNKLLNHLGKIAGRGIDDWMGLIDPTVTYQSNKAKLLEKGGRKTETQRDTQALRLDRDKENLARQHARETIRENFDAIDAGEKAQLVDDIAAEFGQEFVAGELEAIQVSQAEPDTGDFPEPTPVEAEPTPTATVAIDETEDVDPSPVTADTNGRPDILTEVVEFAEFLLMPSETDTAEAAKPAAGPGLFETLSDAIAGAFSGSNQQTDNGSIDDNIQQIRRKRFAN